MKSKSNTNSSKDPYGNYSIYHPNGTLMCFCHKKRMNWYLSRNLAKKLSDTSIQLTFMPNGTGDPLSILEQRKPVCVVSGLVDNLSKHHVIPYQYRKLFPNQYKDKNSTDIVILERNIHNEYETFADTFKIRLEEDFGNPKWKELNYSWVECKMKHRIINSHNYEKLAPKDQVYMKMRYEGLLEKYNFDVSSFEHVSSPYLNDNIKEIINKIGIENLIVLWKLHFIKHANPKYLPDWWKPNLIKVLNTSDDNSILEIDLNEPKLKQLISKYDLDI